MGTVTLGNATETGTLVERALADDANAYGELYDLLAPKIQRYLCSLASRLSHSEVEDAVQETFLRLFRGLESFDRTRSLVPYVLGIARLVALELGRKRKLTSKDLGNLVSTDTPTPDRAERLERRGLVQDALSALAPEQQAALALRHATRLTMQELADSLSCSIPTARSRLREAAHRFSVELRSRGVLEATGGLA